MFDRISTVSTQELSEQHDDPPFPEWRAPYGFTSNTSIGDKNESSNLDFAVKGGAFAAGAAMGIELARGNPGTVTISCLKGLAGAGAAAMLDKTLDSIVGDRLGGNHLFAPNAFEATAVGLAIAAPIPDLRVRLALAGTAWLGGRIYNYFEK